MFRFISTAFFLIIFQISTAQQILKNTTIVTSQISYSNLPDNGYGKNMFKVIAQTNNSSIFSIKFNVKSRVMLRVVDVDNNQLKANISVTEVSEKRNIYLKDFNIDSLMWPSTYNAILTLSDDKGFKKEIEVAGLTNGRVIKIDLEKDRTKLSHITSATISNINYQFNNDDLSKIKDVSKSISYYYSYNELLSFITKSNELKLSSSSKNIENVFINRVLINRIENIIHSHQLYLSLIHI